MKRATTDKGISFHSLNSELSKAGLNAQVISHNLTLGGDRFLGTLNEVNRAFALSNRNVISLNTKIKEMSRVMVQSFKFSLAQQAIRSISNEVRNSIRWVEQLNDEINKIGIVTGKTQSELDAVTERTILAARNLRIAAKEYAEGELIFYQQGLKDDEVQRRTEVTVKAAKAAGENVQQMSSELTSIWNNYKMMGEEQERAASVGAKMAAQTAVDFSDIAEAMQTAAAPAAQMGVSYNSLAAIIATVGDTTQQSASVIGNAFKTIFSRFQQLKAEGTDGEVTLNRVSSQLQDLGVNVLDSSGELRKLDDVIQEVGESWDSWSSKQQLAIAQLVGGTRQYGQFLALMNNYDKYMNNLQSAELEDGSTLEQQYSQYLESIESYAKNAGESWNRAFGEIIDPKAIKSILKLTEELGNTVDALLKGIGGLPGLLLVISTILSKKIFNQIQNGAKSLGSFVSNLTSTGRLNNIRAERDQKISDIDSTLERKDLTQKQRTNLQIQKEKVATDSRIAEINEKINTALETRNRTNQLDLEYKKGQLEAAQQTYTTKLDELNLIEQECQKEERSLQLKTESLNVERQTVEEELKKNANMQKSLKGRITHNKRIEDDPSFSEEERNKAAEKRVQLEEQLKQKELERVALIEKMQTIEEAITKNQIDRMSNSITKAFSQASRGAINTDEFMQAFAQTPQLAEKAKKAIEQLSKGNIGPMRQLQDEVEKLAINMDHVTERTRRADGAFDAFTETQQIKAQVGKIGKEVEEPEPTKVTKVDYSAISSGLMQVAMASSMAMMGVQNFISVLNNTDMTFEQKFSALAFSILQMVTVMGSLIKMLTSLGALLKTTVVDTEAVAAARAKEALATAAANKAEREYYKLKHQMKHQKGKPTQEQKNNYAEAIRRRKSTKEAADAATAERETAEAGTSTLTKIGKDFKSFIGGMSTATKVLSVLGIVAVATSIVVGKLHEEMEKTFVDAKIQRMNKALESLKQKSSEANSQAKDLKSTIDGYKEGVKAISSMAKGTEEWKDKLKEVNSQAIEVIRKIQELNIQSAELKDAYEYKDGLLVINDEALEKAQAEIDHKAQVLQFATDSAQITLNNLTQQQKNTQKLAEMNGRDLEGGIKGALVQGGAGAAGGAGVGALIASIIPIPGVSQAIGAAVGGIIGGIGGLIKGAIEGSDYGQRKKANEQNKIITEHLDELKHLTGDELKNKLVELGFSAETVSKNLDEYAAIIQRAANAQEQQYAATKALMKSNVEAEIGNKKGATAKNLTSDLLVMEENKIAEELTKTLDDTFHQAWDGSSTERNNLIQQYNAAAGTNYTADSNFSRGTDNDRIFAFRDENNKLIELTKEEVVQTIAASQALEKLGSSADEAARILKEVSPELRKFLGTNDFSGMTESEYEAYKQKVDADGEDGVSKDEAKTYLMDVEKLTEEQAEHFAQQMADGFQMNFNDLVHELTPTMRDAFYAINKDGLTYAQQQTMSNLMGGVYSNSGWRQGEIAGELFKQIVEGAGDQADEVLDIFKDINWEEATPDQVIDQLEQQGIATNDFADALRDLTPILKQITEVTLEAAQEIYKTSQDVIDKVAKGEKIDPTEYEKLIELNPDLQDFFIQTKDGFYLMTEDAKKFYSVVNDLSNSGFNQILNQSKQDIDRMEQIKQREDSYSGEDSYYQSLIDYSPDSQFSFTGAFTKDSAGNNVMYETLYDAEKVKEIFDYILAAGGEIDAGWQEILDKNGPMSKTTFEAIMEELASVEDHTGQWTGKINEARDAAEKLKEEMALSDTFSEAEDAGIETNDLKEYINLIKDKAEAEKDSTDGQKEFADSVSEDKVTQAQIALAYARTAKARQQYADSGEDIIKNLKQENKFNDQYMESLKSMRTMMGDLLNINGDMLSTNFLVDPDNLALFESAIKGDEAALDSLAQKAAEDIIVNLDIDQSGKDDLMGLVDDLSTMDDIEIGATVNLDDSAYIAGLNSMLMNGEITETQLNSILGNIGYEPVLEEVDMESEDTVPEVDKTTTPLIKSAPVSTRLPIWTPFGGKLGPQLTGFYEYVAGSTEEVNTEDVPIKKTTKAVGLGTKDNPPSVEVKKKKLVGAKKISGTGNKSASPITSPSTAPTTKSNNSSGGGSKFNPEKLQKAQEDTHKRYENLTEALKDLSRTLDQYSSSMDDAWGPNRIRQMKNYNAQLQKIGRAQKDLINETKNYYKEDKAKLLSDGEISKIARFEEGEFGRLVNPEEIRRYIDAEQKKATDIVNNAIKDYNAKGDSSDAAKERLDSIKEEQEARQEELDGWSKDLDQLLETGDLLKERIMEQMENIYKWMDNKVEEIKYKLEFNIRINEYDMDRLETLIDRMGDTGILLGRDADILSRMWENNDQQSFRRQEATSTAFEKLSNLNNPDNQEWFKTTFGDDAWDMYMKGNGGLPEPVMAFLQDMKDQLTSTLENYIDIALQALDHIQMRLENYFENFAKLTERLDVQVSKLDTLQTILDFKGTNYLTQAGREAQRAIDREKMNSAAAGIKISQAELENRKKSMAALEEEIAVWEKRRQEAIDSGGDTGQFNEEAANAAIDKLTQMRDDMQDEILGLEGDIESGIQDLFATAQEKLEHEKEMAKAKIAITINGLFSDIDEMMDMYDSVYDWQHYNLDDYDKNYYLNDLQKQFDEKTKDMNLEEMKGLTDWQERLNKYKEEGIKMNQDEVDLLQKALDLEIARANFEEAQNAKNTMRLARDASGNWNYIYSNDNADNGAEDELARMEYEYKKAYENMMDNQNQAVMGMAQEMKSVIENINYQLYYSSELYRKSIDTKLSLLSNQLIAAGATIDQVTSIMGNGIKGWEYDFANSSAGIVTNTSSMDEMIKLFLKTLVGSDSGYIPGSSEGFYGDWMEAQRDTAETVNETGESIGRDFGLIQQDIAGSIVEIADGENGSLKYLQIRGQETELELSRTLEELNQDWNKSELEIGAIIGEKGDTSSGTITGDINQIVQEALAMKDDTSGALDNLLGSIHTWGESFHKEFMDRVADVQALIDKIAELENQASKQMDEDIQPDEEATQEKPTTGGNTGGDNTSKPSGPSHQELYEAVYDVMVPGKYGNGESRKQQLEAKFPGSSGTIQKIVNYVAANYANAWATGRGFDAAIKAALKHYGFKKGGLADFTGPAWLDGTKTKPELVLNQADTQNILEAVRIMRDSVAQKLNALNSNIGTPYTPAQTDSGTQKVEQQVHIEASFPNVSVADEIEQAFNSLLNQVAQYNIKK